MSAVNWVFYVNDPNSWSLFAGIFCGFMALASLVVANVTAS
jgi:hypothetical protein